MSIPVRVVLCVLVGLAILKLGRLLVRPQSTHRVSRGVVELSDGRSGSAAPDDDLPDFGEDGSPVRTASRAPGRAGRSPRPARFAAKAPDAAGRYRALATAPAPRTGLIDPTSLDRAFHGKANVVRLNGPGGERVVDPEHGPLTFDGHGWVPLGREAGSR